MPVTQLCGGKETACRDRWISRACCPLSLAKTVNFRLSGKPCLKIYGGKQWRTIPSINLSCPHAGTGEHTYTYTKYIHTHKCHWVVILWFLFYFIHGVCLYICSFVYTCMCTCVWKVDIDDWWLALSASKFSSPLELSDLARLTSQCIPVMCLPPPYLVLGLQTWTITYCLLLYESWGFILSFLFLVQWAQHFTLYPQSYLLCPNICFKYIHFHWFSFTSNGMTVVII